MRIQYLLFISFFWTPLHSNASIIDSLVTSLNNLDSLQQTEKWVETALDLGEEYYYEPNYGKAVSLYQRAYAVAAKSNLTNLKNRSSWLLAKGLHRQGHYAGSLKYAQKMLLIYPKDSLVMLGEAYRLIGINQVLLGNYTAGFEAQMDARSVYEELQDSVMLARVEYGLGNNFFYQNQYELSLKHFQNALRISEQFDVKEGIFQANNAIGSILENQGQFEKAIQYSQKALVIARATDDEGGIGWTLMNIGSSEIGRGNYQRGCQKLEEALVVAQKIDDKPLEGYIYNTLANAYEDQNQDLKALTFYEKSYEIARLTNDRSNMVSLYQEIADLWFKQNDLSKYQEYTEKYQSLRDSLYSDELAENLGSLKQEFQLNEMEKANEIELLKKEQEVERVKMLSNYAIFAAAVIIFGLLILLMYYRNKNHREKNALLKQKNEEILRQNEMLLASNQDLEKFAFIISHDLKEPLRSISGFTSLLDKRTRHLEDENIQKYVEFITGSTRQLHQLLNDLLAYSKLNIKAKSHPEWVNTEAVVEEIVQSLPNKALQSAKVEVNDLPEIYMEKPHLHQIFHQLLSNSVKFKKEVPLEINIAYEMDEQFHNFSISDNGIGIDKAYHDQIFTVFQRLHTRQKYDGSGVGLSTCKKIIERYGGRIWVNSEEGKGATFFFSIPKNRAMLN